MYVEALQTPHPESSIYTPGIQQESLIEAADIAGAREHIATATDRSAAILDVANHIDGVVHHTLRWDYDRWPQPPEASSEQPAVIPADQIVNCIGYALVTAELFDQAGIKDNYLMYLNGHAMNGVVTGSGASSRLHKFDPGNQAVGNIDMTSTLRGVTLPDLLADAAHGRGVARINTEDIIRQAGLDFGELEENHSYPWLHHNKGKAPTASNLHADPHRSRQSRYTCFLSIYPYESGRGVLTGYSMLAGNAIQGDVDAALAGVHAMRGLQPELDGRVSHAHIRSLVGRLAIEGRDNDALEATQSYCASFRVSKDPRLRGVTANLYKVIADITGDEGMRGVAIQAFREAEELARYKSTTFSGKRAKLQTAQGVTAA